MAINRKPNKWKNKGKKRRGYVSPPSFLGSNMRLTLITNKKGDKSAKQLTPLQQILLSHHTRSKNPNNITIKEKK